MSGIEYDKYKIYRGKDIKINNNFVVSIPTLSQIEEFGEQLYFSAMHNLNACGADLKWQLWDYYNIDYTKIEDYDLFLKFTSQLLSSKKYIKQLYISDKSKFEIEINDDELDKMDINPLYLTLKYSDGESVDLADFDKYMNNTTNQLILWNKERDITIDRFVYTMIVDAIRNIHGFKRNNQMPANERTKMDLIEDARDESRMLANKEYESSLLPLISTLRVNSGNYSTDFYNMPISELFYNVKRMGKIKDATLLLQGAYSGFASLKDVDKDRLDMFGNI